MSLWQFYAMAGGAAKANAADDSAITPEQAEALAAWIDEPPAWH